MLDAAEAVFARQGWWGATTAEIARVAQVNEVTLFRHFTNKQGLMEAVVVRYVEVQQRQLAAIFREETDLPKIVDLFSKAYSKSLLRSVGFVRTMVAESSQRPKQVQKVIHDAVKPLRQQLVSLFRDLQSRGAIRAELDYVVALDLLSGMLFANAIKPRLPGSRYSHETYRRMCVEVFLRGVQS